MAAFFGRIGAAALNLYLSLSLSPSSLWKVEEPGPGIVPWLKVDDCNNGMSKMEKNESYQICKFVCRQKPICGNELFGEPLLAIGSVAE